MVNEISGVPSRRLLAIIGALVERVDSNGLILSEEIIEDYETGFRGLEMANDPATGSIHLKAFIPDGAPKKAIP